MTREVPDKVQMDFDWSESFDLVMVMERGIAALEALNLKELRAKIEIEKALVVKVDGFRSRAVQEWRNHCVNHQKGA